jgi:hypothetical protein
MALGSISMGQIDKQEIGTKKWAPLHSRSDAQFR